MRPTRVLLVGPAPAGPDSRGGMATVTRLMLDDPDPSFEITCIPTYLDTAVWHRTWVGVLGALTAAWRVLTGRVDVLHVHLAHGGSVARKAIPLLAARLRGVPAVVHGHSFDFVGWFERLPAPARAVVRAALPARRWLVLGSTLASEYARALRLAPDAVEVLYNPVAIAADAVDQHRPGPLTVVALGRLGERKGSFDLVAAVAALPPQTRAAVRVIAAGDGAVAEVRQAVAQSGISDILTVKDWISPAERDELLRAAHVFALPSYHEGLPMALLEAMTVGLVPLTSPVGGIPEVITDDVTGLLVAPGDRDALAQALSRLAGDPHLRARLGAAARARADDFAVSGWYDRLHALWRALANAPATAPSPTR